MTKAELIEKLDEYPDHWEIFVTIGSDDMVGKPVTQAYCIDEGEIGLEIDAIVQ